MGVFGRLKEMAVADIHHVLDQMEDPICMGKQYIRQVEEQLDETRNALGKQIALKQQYDLMITSTSEIVSKRHRQAELALQGNEEAIAEMAVQDKLYHQHRMQDYEQQQEIIQQQISILKEQILKLTDIHQELKNRLYFLKSRIQAAQSLKAASTTISALDTRRLTRNFNRIEERLRYFESESTWHYGSSLTDPTSKLDAFEAQEKVKAELEMIRKGQEKE